MKDFNKLFELVQTMSPAEKGYFKKYTLIHAKTPDQVYIRLFNIISLQKEYDEKKLVEELKKSSFSKKLGPYQNYLYKLILKSQRAFYSDVSYTTKTMELLTDALLLRDKGLLRHSNKLLEQAKKSATEEDDLIMLLKIQQYQRENNNKKGSINLIISNFNELHSEALKSIENIKEELEINRLRSEIYSFDVRYGDDVKDPILQSKVKKILSSPFLDIKRKYPSTELLYWSLFVRKTSAALLGKPEEAIAMGKMQISLIEKHTLFHSRHLQKRYGLLLCDILRNFKVLKIQDAENIFKKIQSLKPNTLQDEIDFFCFSYSNMTGAYIEHQLPHKGVSLIPEQIKRLKKYSNKLPNSSLLIIYANISVLYFMTHHLKNALKWMNKTLELSSKQLRQDIYSDIRILNILIHYELGNFILVDSLLLSLERFLIKEKMMDAFSKTVIYHLKKIVFLNDKKEKNERLLTLKSKLNQLLENEADKKTHLLYWIEQKLK